MLPLGGKGFSIAGADITQTVAGFEYRRQSRIDGGVFTAVVSARSVEPEFPAAEAAADQKALRELAKTALEVKVPTGHAPIVAETAWGIFPANGTAVGYIKNGSTLFKHREYAAAVADFDAALALDSRNDSALDERGGSYAAEGMTNAAVAGKSRDAAFLETRGFVLLRLAQYPKAITDYDAALKIDPFRPTALHGRGICKSREGKAQQADADIRAATALSYQVADQFAHYGVEP